jgi:DNA modification methylase
MSTEIERYRQFLRNKVALARESGFLPPSEPHSSLLPHQRDIAAWAVRGGCRAIFAAFGLGKTRMHLQVAKWIIEKERAEGGKRRYLIVAPLGVRQEFTRNDGPAMGMDIRYCRTDAEVAECDSDFIITNYERVRDGALTVSGEVFAGAGLDEASVLRSFGSKTYQGFLRLFDSVQYRFVFTATPSPNRHKELIHYGGFLGIMDTGQALTRFFQRDSEKAGNLTLYPHMEEKFWLWMSSWAVFLEKPSDLGYSDEGYDLPPMNVHWHMVDVDHRKAWGVADSFGQSQLFVDQSSGLKEVAECKRETMETRLRKAVELIDAEAPEKHWLIWHDLEAERRLIEQLIPGVKTVYGSQDLDIREDLILGFSRGEYRILATKPVIAGSGCNFQKHCADAIFVGSTYKFNDFIQAVHRIQRFQQSRPVNIHVIYSESEAPVIQTLKAKWAQHEVLVGKMTEILRRNKLEQIEVMKLTRTMGCNRVEVSGETFRAIHNDCVEELATWPENSVDQIVTSIPFGNQYEYSPSYNDFGHNPDNAAFFEQMEFLVPNLLRVLKPGRVACIHVKDRIRFGNVTGLGMPTVDRFSDKTADLFEKHGFVFFGRISIDTDVVRENNQTYRLGWSENAKDSTKMGVGMQEYVLLLRKLPSDLSDAYADKPVTKDKAEYTRAAWQIDAAGFWKSDGNRLMDPDYLLHIPHDAILRMWREHCSKHGYDFAQHVELGRELENRGKLPASFMLFPPVSKQPDIWTDIARMRVLNSEQSRRNQENHVCPLQLDIVNRLIGRYSNPGEWVLDPFGGIHTVPYCAIKAGRKGVGIELNREYWRCGVGYCENADAERTMPTLFDIALTGEEVAA